jgi:hypothetical protein
MDDPTHGFVEGVRQCFHDLPDPRVVNRCQHQVLDILAMAILAVLSGADDWTDIEVFAETREDWLAQFLELPGGIPSHDTFRRVFSLFERKQFAVCLLRWTQALAMTASPRNDKTLALARVSSLLVARYQRTAKMEAAGIEPASRNFQRRAGYELRSRHFRSVSKCGVPRRPTLSRLGRS